MTSKTSGKATTGKTTTGRTPTGKQSSREVRQRRGGRSGNRAWIIAWALLAVVAVGGLYLLYSWSADGQGTASGTASGYRHVAGEPGAGSRAPEFTLPASTGGMVSLSDYRGKRVLLYFQEG